MHDFSFYRFASAGKRVSCIENLEDNIAGLDDFLHFFPVLARLLEVLEVGDIIAVFLAFYFFLERSLLHHPLNIGELFLLETLDKFIAVGLLALERLDHAALELR